MIKKMLKNFIKKLFIKYCDPDWSATTRQQLKMFDGNLDLLDLPMRKRIQLAKKSNQLLADDDFIKILDLVISELKYSIMMTTPDSKIINDRLSINGISLVVEKMEELKGYDPANQKKQQVEEEEYDD